MRTLIRWWLARRDRLADDRTSDAQASALAWAWRLACIGAGLGRDVGTVTGPTTSTPRLVHVTLGPPAVLVVELLPGQLPGDVRDAASRLAPHLGYRTLRVSRRGHRHVAVTLLQDDPLGPEFPLPPAAELGPRLLLARDERGHDVVAFPEELPHLVVQGQTRSGKSAWLYALLAQLVDRRGVRIAGVDPTGLLLRPFSTGGRPAPLQAVGLADPARIVTVLDDLVAEMDRRVAEIDPRSDRVALSWRLPLIVVVLEEWPGVLRLLDQLDARGAGKAARAAVSRLLAEGHKAGLRVVMVCQRADAAVIGGAERANIGGRVTFRVDAAEAVKMLHPGAGLGLVHEITTAPPGVALLELPGRSVGRVRSPWIGGYGAFVDRIRAVGAHWQGGAA